MGDSQRFALENSPQIANMMAIHQNFRRYCRKAILYPIWGPVRVRQSKLSVFGPPVYPNNSFHLEQSSVGDKLL